MPWIGAEYNFASTFSYRLPDFSSSYALSAPIPSPSTIKLALVSGIISRKGNIERGKQLFEQIRTVKVTTELPDRIATFKCFIKRLKKKRQGKGFEPTFGIREYIIYNGPLRIFLNVSNQVMDDVKDALKAVSYLGTSDSLCTCTEFNIREPLWNKCPQLYDSEHGKEGILFMLTEFTNEVAFENVNPYSEVRMIKGKHIVTKPYLFPIHIMTKESNYVIYETN
ncbi:CRISPR-associated protein Cas5 [Candidatus Bathyarchaeota archaeon]|nr:CRISPR-associated protein Cas5 [Candidatus Bathyarchaeota archaeon]